MNKKTALFFIGTGLSIALLICVISITLYERVYFFDGYEITSFAWIVAIGCFIVGIIGLSTAATCRVCGKDVVLSQCQLTKDNAPCCPECWRKAHKNGNSTVNAREITIDGLKRLIDSESKTPETNREYRKKCNVCGHIFCYTDSDIDRNLQLEKEARSNAGMAFLEAVAGSRIASNQESAAADSVRARIIDYSKCPKCNSTSLSDATEKEIHQSSNRNSNSAVSNADELKKYKELLDGGAITQEEYDAKKKQLLGL